MLLEPQELIEKSLFTKEKKQEKGPTFIYQHNRKCQELPGAKIHTYSGLIDALWTNDVFDAQ